MKNNYWLSEQMAKYIVSVPDNYQISENRYILNPSIARTITTREGSERMHICTYLSPDCGDDQKVKAGGDGYPVKYNDRDSD